MKASWCGVRSSHASIGDIGGLLEQGKHRLFSRLRNHETGSWYGRYLDTFTSLGKGERTDLESLLSFFGVPLVIVTEDRYLALSTRDAVLGMAETLIDQLLQANFAGSTVHRLDIHPLNTRAASVEGVLSRHDRAGNELE